MIAARAKPDARGRGGGYISGGPYPGGGGGGATPASEGLIGGRPPEDGFPEDCPPEGSFGGGLIELMACLGSIALPTARRPRRRSSCESS